jgi:hypothetical protein
MPYAEEAKKAVYAFHEAFSKVDVAGMADACNFPHVRLALGKFTTHETREDFIRAGANLKDRLKVHFAIVNKRQHTDGTVYKPFNTFWIATLQDGHWGIQFRSSYLT